MPVSVGKILSSFVNASRPPAEAPTPTIGNKALPDCLTSRFPAAIEMDSGLAAELLDGPSTFLSGCLRALLFLMEGMNVTGFLLLIITLLGCVDNAKAAFIITRQHRYGSLRPSHNLHPLVPGAARPRIKFTGRDVSL